MTIDEAFTEIQDSLMKNTKGMPNEDFLEVLDHLESEIETHRKALAEE